MQTPERSQQILANYVHIPLHKKWSFPLRISSVNVIKSLVSCGFNHIYWKKSLMENFIFCAVLIVKFSNCYDYFWGYQDLLISLAKYLWSI